MSEEFGDFMKANGIHHIRSAPYHPATNGLAERMVQTFKSSLKAAKANSATIQRKLDKFLMAYRNAPHATTHRSPAQHFYGRSLRSRLDLLKPDNRRRVIRSQTEQAKYQGSKAIREFSVGDIVLARDYRGQKKWMRGEIVARHGMHYDVKMAPNTCWRRHIDQILGATAVTEEEEGPIMPAKEADCVNENFNHEAPTSLSQEHVPPTVHREAPAATDMAAEIPVATTTPLVTATATTAPTSTCTEETDITESAPSSSVQPHPLTERRYPLRKRKPPQFFDPSTY